MSEDDPIDEVRGGLSIVTDLIKAAGDNENVREAANNLGKAAVTLTKTINNALLPIAAINYGFDKARQYFSSQFANDLAQTAARIPLESIVAPKPSIAGPALQGLAFSHEEQDLKQMYLNLLATAMDDRHADDAHPAFVEIIRQLNANEARLIRGALLSKSPIASVQIVITENPAAGHSVAIRHMLNFRNTDTQEPLEEPRLPAMIDNWERLGLVETHYETFLTAADAYAWVEKRPEVLRLKAENESTGKLVEWRNGILRATDLGRLFAKAVGVAE